MKQHLNDGQLRASLDGELAEAEQQHLNSCPNCQARLAQVQHQIRPTGDHLAFLTSHEKETHLDAQAALPSFYHFNSIRKEKTMFRKLFASPVLKIGLAVVLILVIVLSVPATRTLAGQFLSLFRVQQVVVVPVDYTGMEQLTGNSALGNQFSQLISTSITAEQKPGAPVTATDAAQASQLAGFTVRLPQGMSPSRISVEKSSAFSFRLDRAKVQALLNEAGRSDLVLPASIDGAEVSINIPASVSVAYGTCPEPGAQENDSDLSLNGSAGRRYPDCVILAELPSPTVSAPADINIAQLAQIGFEFTGMTSDQAAAFTKTVNWTSSLVIPIPKNAATYEQVMVDGVTGTLIQRPADDAPQYILVWIKDGIIYAISSLGSNSQQAIQMANSLP
ncbi:MAG: DUF4367 domain-containing protein [Anaerolineales bacterium]